MDSSKFWLEKIEDWQLMVKKLAEAKQAELEARKRLAEAAFPDPVEGTSRVYLPDGRALKLEYRINRKLDPAALADLDLPQDVISRVVRTKQEVDMKQYRNLSEDHRQKFDACLTITPGTPALTLEDPSQKMKK